MAKTTLASHQQSKFEDFAKRRAGVGYLDAALAVQTRLQNLRNEYANTPPGYRGYIAVGICSCLESHMKYVYGAAAERFSEHPDVLKTLFKSVNVDMETLIATTSKTFQLSDVVAASISVSTLAAYRSRASEFLAVFTGNKHDFPWGDFMKAFVTNGLPDLEKEYAEKLKRLERVFDARHKFVHETNVYGENETLELLGDNPLDCVDDAMWLISQFQKQFLDIEMSSKYALVKDDEGLDDAVTRNVKEIEAAFDSIKEACEERQYEKLVEFKRTFLEYLYARSDFQASVFVAQQSEASMSYFIDLAPEYREMLRNIGPKTKYMLSQFPLSRQYEEMGLTAEGKLPPDEE